MERVLSGSDQIQNLDEATAVLKEMKAVYDAETPETLPLEGK
jgi:hypothetical protein